MKWVSSSVLALGLALLSVASQADTTEKRVPADARGQVDIVNRSGSIKVRGWNRSEVEVRVDLESNQHLRFENDGRHTLVRIDALGPSSSSTDLVVQVPEGSALSINSISAEQRVRNVRGSQRLQSVSGEIETEVWADDLQVKTISGDIQVTGHKQPGVIDISSISGTVTLHGLAGEVELETVSGDARVTMGELTRGRVRTTSGSVEWASSLARDARLDAEALSGDLKFRLGGKVDAEFDIETFAGEIENCFGPRAKQSREFGPGQSLRFVEGKGGARVAIKTHNGGVEICDH